MFMLVYTRKLLYSATTQWCALIETIAYSLAQVYIVMIPILLYMHEWKTQSLPLKVHVHVKPFLSGQHGTGGAHNLQMPVTEKHVYCV